MIEISDPEDAEEVVAVVPDKGPLPRWFWPATAGAFSLAMVALGIIIFVTVGKRPVESVVEGFQTEAQDDSEQIVAKTSRASISPRAGEQERSDHGQGGLLEKDKFDVSRRGNQERGVEERPSDKANVLGAAVGGVGGPATKSGTIPRPQDTGTASSGAPKAAGTSAGSPGTASHAVAETPPVPLAAKAVNAGQPLPPRPFRVATNGLAGTQFIDPISFGPDWLGYNDPGTAEPWVAKDAFARLTTKGALDYPRLPVSRYVCEVDLTVFRPAGMKFCLGDTRNA